MKPAAPALPVSPATFHEMVRLHVYGRTDEAIAKELGIELRVVRDVRWGCQEQWDAAVDALIPTFTKEMVFQTVAAIHLLASMTTDTKELATLAHAEERHLRLVQPKKTRTKKARPQRPAPVDPIEELLHEEEPMFTAAELALVAQLRAAHPLDVVFLCELQVQHEELYFKCRHAGILPPWPDPNPPSDSPPIAPTPPAEAPAKTFGQRLRAAAIAVLLVFSVCWWSSPAMAQAHPPNH